MCSSIEHRLLFGSSHQAPVKPKAKPYVDVASPINDRVSKTFLTNNSKENVNPNQFYRDVQGKEKVLVYNHQTIYAKYKNDFIAINDLETIHQQIIRAQRENPSDENQKLYDDIQEEIDAKTDDLKSKIKADFGGFLADRLGPARTHLIPIITDRFSQKAFTTFITQVNEHTTKKYGGFFTDGDSSEECALHIPAQGPVQIEATTQGIYRSFMPANQAEMQPRAVQLNGQAIYTIGLNGKTEANVDFSITELP